jgi:hypothetical protein
LLGAFPPGRLSEIVGPWSSGGSSLLLALIARVTTSGGQAALVDGADAFDPSSAAAAGADLSALLWIKCGGRLDPACRAADLLARCPGFALVAVDLGALPPRRRTPSSLWLRLQRAVEGSATALVLRAPERLAGNVAALVVAARRLESRWTGLPQPTRFAGLASELQILRSRAHPDALDGDGQWTIEWRA